MKARIHLMAAIVTALAILAFFSSTVLVEAFGGRDAVTIVKHLIVYGLAVLVPAIAATGVTGFLLSRSNAGSLVRTKKKRMSFIAANGLLVLVPSAVYLDQLAGAGAFGPAFIAVQTLELVVGAANLTLIAMNMRDGLRLTGRWSRDIRA
jgi:hypothetical protein